MKQSLGHLDPVKIYQLPLEKLALQVEKLPKKPRYTNAAPYMIQDITCLFVEKYCGTAELIWKNRRSSEVRKDFLSIYGGGPGIADMAVLLIEKGFGVRFSDLDHSRRNFKPDAHTMRILFRLGVAAAEGEQEAVLAGRSLNPSYPGEIDAALWLIGRSYCMAGDPHCNSCPLDEVYAYFGESAQIKRWMPHS
ncbi:MAG: hypothetical protein M1281_15205 [Chloroflexi bacterium]|nr:hypothetical protein [Chloroflexota bacterium]